MNKNLRLSLPLAALVLAACSQTDGPSPPAPPPASAPAPASTASTASVSASAANDVKPEIPSLKVNTFDGGSFDLSAHRGRWVVVNFWATWCTPCLKEIPDLDELNRSRADVDVIGLAFEEIEHADMAAFLKEHPIHYPIAVLDVYNPPADFDTPRGLPMTYLISPDGKVAKKFFGPTTTEDLVRLIKSESAPGA